MTERPRHDQHVLHPPPVRVVVRVGVGGERELNERFVELHSWYLFDTRFCNVESGNEKGDVENLVKRSQRTYLTPVPTVTSMPELADHLRLGCERDLERIDRGQTLSRRSLLAVERTKMLALPATPFPACTSISMHVSKQSLVRIDGNDYSVPTRYLPFAEWPSIFAGDARLAGALIDRLTHRVHVMEIPGDSYRLKQSLKSKEGGEPSSRATKNEK